MVHCLSIVLETLKQLVTWHVLRIKDILSTTGMDP